MPRRTDAPGVSCRSGTFHASVPASALSATTLPAATRNIVLPTTIGAGPPCGYDHASVRRATLAGVTSVTGAYFVAPASPATFGQSSPRCCACATAPAQRPIATILAETCSFGIPSEAAPRRDQRAGSASLGQCLLARPPG